MIPLHPQPLRGFDYLGEHRYFLTFCTCWRRPLFTAPDRVDVARTQILRAATDENFELIAYCFMPDHVHLLAVGCQPTSNCRRFITRAKQFARYIIENPIRAGLVRSVNEYPYLGSTLYTIDQILDSLHTSGKKLSW